MTETATDVGEHEGNIPSFRYHLLRRKSKGESKGLSGRVLFTFRLTPSAFRLPPYFCTSFCTRQLRVSAT